MIGMAVWSRLPKGRDHMAGPHHKGRYTRYARAVRDAANANPNTVCWRDGHTLTQHQPGATWTAGHTIDGSPTATPWLQVTRVPPPGDWLAPEASSCNYSNGAHRTNRLRNNPRSTHWLT